MASTEETLDIRAVIDKVNAAFDKRPGPAPEPKDPAWDLPFRIASEVLLDIDTRGELPWQVTGLAFTGGTTLIAGPPKKGKTTIVAQMLAARARSDDFLGRRTHTGPLLILTEEGDRPWAHHFGPTVHAYVEVGQNCDVVLISAAIASYGNLPPWEATMEKVAAWCKATKRLNRSRGAPLVLIDTLAMWAGVADENDAATMTRCITQLQAVAHEEQVAIVLIHHARKSGGVEGNAIRGSGAILATVDVGIEMRTKGEDSDDRELRTQGRMTFPERIRLTFDRATMLYSLNEEDEKLTRIEGYLVGIPATGDGMTVKALSDLWDVNETNTRDRIKALLNVGRMRDAGDPADKRQQRRLYWSIPAVPRPREEQREEDDE